MINFSTEISKAKALIATDSDVTLGNKVVSGFETTIVPSPLKGLYTVIKPLNLKITKETNIDTGTTNIAKFTIGVTIHKAEKLDPSDLLGKFSLMIALFESSKEFVVDSCGFDEMERSADTNSIYLPGWVTFIYTY